MTERLPRGQTVNQRYCLQVLTTLGERARRKRPEPWENDRRILRQDNAPAHNASIIRSMQFLAENRTPALATKRIFFTPYDSCEESQGHRIRHTSDPVLLHLRRHGRRRHVSAR